ncbi:MAG TPA: hypothetical protein VHQ23_19865 [Ilumatobacteraceae bacterium]|nr:hypothetical protein [Ilumatobacteraceae bacterium]
MGDTTQRVDRLLDEIIDARRPVVVSSLAEGADRMVADLVLARPRGGLSVVLPLAAEDYERDFTTDASVAQFRALLARAENVETVEVPADASREQAYEQAGHRVVERCEVLIAIWDGSPSCGRGGTAEIVDHARRVGRRVELVGVTRGGPS